MAVSIRLTRTGARNARAFRLVAADRRSPRDGRFIETLGWYDPARQGETFRIDVERVEYWQRQGAVLSDTVANLLKEARAAGGSVPAEAVPPSADDEAEGVAAPAGTGEAADTAGEAETEAAESEPPEERDS